MESRILPYLLVGTGSMIGGLSRYALSRGVGAVVSVRFPLATLLVNLVGSFLLGLLGGVLAQRPGPNADALRLALGVGFCGGFTTFSTFELETHDLLGDGRWLSAVSYVVSSLFAGLLALRLGGLAAKSWL